MVFVSTLILLEVPVQFQLTVSVSYEKYMNFVRIIQIL